MYITLIHEIRDSLSDFRHNHKISQSNLGCYNDVNFRYAIHEGFSTQFSTTRYEEARYD